MKITTEAACPKIGVNDQIVDSIKNNKWAIRIGFKDENDTSRYEVCLTEQEARNLIESINVSLYAIDDIKRNSKNV